MSILIPGMEMPTRCYACPCADLEYYDCNLMPGARIEQHKRLDDCPLVPVPKHGDLIDRDALPTYDKPIGKLMMFGGEYVYTQTAIDNAPTIIPADGNLYDSLKRGFEQAINGESRSETILAKEGEG